jgi:hypothetical protein
MTTTAPPAPVTINGTICDPEGYPLAGITIRLYDDGHGSLVDTTTTDDAGHYRFTNVLNGGADRYRFEADDMTGRHVYCGSPSFVVKAGVTATHHLTMRIAGIIQGKVATEGNGVIVAAEAEHWAGEATVSPNGAFRLGGLAPGTYTVTLRDLSETTGTDVLKVKVTAGKTTTLKPQKLSSLRATDWASRPA